MHIHMSTLDQSTSVPNILPSVDTLSACPRSTTPPLYPNTYRAWTPHMKPPSPTLSTLKPSTSVPKHIPSVDTPPDETALSTLDPSPSVPNQPPSVDRAPRMKPLYVTAVFARLTRLCTQLPTECGHPLHETARSPVGTPLLTMSPPVLGRRHVVATLQTMQQPVAAQWRRSSVAYLAAARQPVARCASHETAPPRSDPPPLP
jgi:hypothetical protein